jgi:hypothetical protein
MHSTTCITFVYIAVCLSQLSSMCRVLVYMTNTTTNSNKSPTRCNNFQVYYPDVYLQLNMFREFFRPSSGAQWLQWQPLVLSSYRGDSRAVFVVGPVINVRIINWKIVASGWWFIWIVRWCTDLQTLNLKKLQQLMDTQYTVVFQSGIKQLVRLRSIFLIYGDKFNCLHSPASYVWLSIHLSCMNCLELCALTLILLMWRIRRAPNSIPI